MINPDRKPGVKLVTDRLQAPRIGAEPLTRNHDAADRVVRAAEKIAKEAAEKELK